MPCDIPNCAMCRPRERNTIMPGPYDYSPLAYNYLTSMYQPSPAEVAAQRARDHAGQFKKGTVAKDTGTTAAATKYDVMSEPVNNFVVIRERGKSSATPRLVDAAFLTLVKRAEPAVGQVWRHVGTITGMGYRVVAVFEDEGKQLVAYAWGDQKPASLYTTNDKSDFVERYDYVSG